MTLSNSGLRIEIKGIVQGVGFRPFIFGLATRLDLKGWVRNTSSGVEIEVSGTTDNLTRFAREIRESAPPLSRILSLVTHPIPAGNFDGFQILTSQAVEGEFIPISPDVSVCPDCLREMLDPKDRRYRYPFINCTNCGPRFTIVKDIPYDRPLTTMANFPLCPECTAEYNDPHNRRFHAQPVACPTCGPHISFIKNSIEVESHEAALQIAREFIREGQIVAVKGLGGYLLACDATNPQAVARLRDRKKRSDKPFALMAYDLEAIKRHCFVTPLEEELLFSIQRPIVLLERKPGSAVNEYCAPNLHTLGFMLPYTPLHYLLLEPTNGFPDALVMTSGNLSEEPIAYTDEDAMSRLNSIADAFLTHNRPIHMRMDDSVHSISDGKPAILRRARGFAPSPILLAENTPPALGAGAELKNTFCLSRTNQAFLSHHIGDLENYETLHSYEEAIQHYQRLFRISPQVICCDMHPDYLASRYAAERASAESLPLMKVQHHHAYLAACLADNGISTLDPVIGLTFDGTGFGLDGTIWGGEILVGSYDKFERAYSLQYAPLPGGDAGVRRPSRMALGWLYSLGMAWDEDLPPVFDLNSQELEVLAVQLKRSINTPLTSSMGRLFDAVASLVGVRQQASYEGQAAIELEAIADPNERGSYEFDISGKSFSPAHLFSALIKDLRAGVQLPILSARFHNSVANLSLELCRRIRSLSGIETIALSGGVWQNRFLIARTVYNLETNGFTILRHQQTPVNDGCIALGQLMVAIHQDQF